MIRILKVVCLRGIKKASHFMAERLTKCFHNGINPYCDLLQNVMQI
jgi:hypothetical protein